MVAKILMCGCYMEKFDSEENDYIKKVVHFCCKCKDKHRIYAFFCKDHPYGSNVNYQMIERKCLRANGHSHEVYQFCFNVRHLLNFKCFKICIEFTPLSFENELVTFCQCFKSTKECELFFLQSGD